MFQIDPPITVLEALRTSKAMESAILMQQRTIAVMQTQRNVLRAGTSLSFVLAGSSASVGRRTL
jgi:hypothetical protein